MCGIVAYVGRSDAVPILIEGLHRLEYRGYDSAGLAVLTKGGLVCHKTKGTVRDLEARLPGRLAGRPGIGHTRWATHGEPSDRNAHPHLDATGQIAVVHNGIVENADELRAELTEAGVELRSDTDTEVFAHLIARAPGTSLADSVRAALRKVQGTYGLAVLDARFPDVVVVARNGSPVVLGIGQRELLAASDVAALVRHCDHVVHLDDGEVATLSAQGYHTTTLDAATTEKVPVPVTTTAEDYDKGHFPHYMLKEIHEQPVALERVLGGRLDDRFAGVRLGGLEMTAREARAFRRVRLLGCGSAYYAGELGAHLIEEVARIPSAAEAASEFRYRNPVVEPDTLYVAISQSGETFDTLAAVQELRRRGARVVGVVNVVGSSIARACEGGIYVHAGPEVSVTSTKTFTNSVVALTLLGIYMGRIRDLSPADGRRLVAGLRALPAQVRQVLALEEEIAAIARTLSSAPGLFFIGRVRGYAVAREGAQKLKEVSYLHAEAYPAGELKHGPLALVGPELPTIAVVPDDDLLDKNLSSLGEIRARRGPVVAVAHRTLPAHLADQTIVVPRNEPELDPVLLGIPLQLLAYHLAVALGRDVDRPRNLAKSVTVE